MTAHVPQFVPTNLEAEQALLGAVLVNNKAYYAPRVGGRLLPEHFHEQVHQQIWAAIDETIRDGKLASPVLIKDRFPGGKITDTMSVGQYLVTLAANAVTIVNAPSYADAIYDSWVRRRLISVAEDLRLAAMDVSLATPPNEIVDDAMAGLQSAVSTEAGADTDTADAYYEFLTAPFGQINAGVPITYPPLAAVLNESHFEAGNLYGMLSGSGEGKTSMVLQLAAGALKQGHPVLILSFDQSPSQIAQQMAQQSLGITMKRQRERRVSDQEFQQLIDFGRELRGSAFKVMKCTDEKADRLSMYAIKWQKCLPADHKPPLIVVDYIQAVTPDDARADAGTKSRMVSRQMKVLAERVHGAVLVLHQRNNDGNNRQNPRPIKKDLYGGEAARWDYDAVFYLYRPDTYRQQQLDSEPIERHGRIHKQFEGWAANDAEIGLLKHRFGDGRAKERIEFQPQFTRYLEPDLPEQGGFL
jgi:replicative DNA helicase